MLLRLARKLVLICEISNQGLTMGIEDDGTVAPHWFSWELAPACCWALFSVPISPLSPVSEFESQCNQGNFIFIGVFLVIKKMSYHLYLRNVASEA